VVNIKSFALIVIVIAATCVSAPAWGAEEAEAYLPEFPPWAKIIEALPNPVEVRTVQVDGHEQTYRVYVPDHTEPLPVLLAYPGRSGVFDRLLRFYAPLAEEKKFIAVFPEFPNRKLIAEVNALMQKGGVEAALPMIAKNAMRDVATARAVLADVIERSQVDRSRVFAVGTSQGGIFCHTLASQASDVVAGIVPLIGSMEVSNLEFNPKYPVSVLSIISEKDSVIARATQRGILAPTDKILARYREQNGLVGEPEVSWLPDIDPGDEVKVRVERYRPGKGGVLFEWWVAEGADHAVHGYPREGDKPRNRKGVSQDFFLPDLVWDFMQRCPPRELSP
jgi:poly(3-hydroxybutyrate) depolymerase